ncbi:unnamed protein product [Linum trigynum]|uniref:Glycosyltransferase n=2 Tax=Linum trigynum TaxID=586398 RepID=A0AAV2GHL1_9ROSI
MVTWPMFEEQFYNEKLVMEVLGIGVAVGATDWVRLRGGKMRGEDSERAVRKFMDGDSWKAGEMRERARKVGETARRAVEEGGSSWKDLYDHCHRSIPLHSSSSLPSKSMDPQHHHHHQLHVVFLPFMAQGHMIPITDMARLFARRGVKSTIITTPLNAPLFSGKIRRDAQSGLPIETHIIEFPCAEAGLPEGCENVNAIKSPELMIPFFKSMAVFQRPVEDLLRNWRPDCIVADVVFTWATETAGRLCIPRLFFNGTGAFAVSLLHALKFHEPYKEVESDSEPFLLPGLPHEIQLTKLQLPPFLKGDESDSGIKELREKMEESEVNSFGAVVNSFHELEPGYAEYYRKVMGRKAWLIGPLSLGNKDGTKEKAERGNVASAAGIDEHDHLRWLDGMEPNSVLYICFGSISNMSNAQLCEIAGALDSSEQRFIWVVKKGELLPEGFEERMNGKGIVIKGWAPQVLILDHTAIGGFMTHCGWNSTLEAVAAGVPMVTWPLQAEQFLNEKLVTDVLKIGVGVGAQEWSRGERKIVVGREDIERAMTRVMVGQEAKELRGRARKLQKMAVMANEEGGSSNSDLKSLLEELTSLLDKKL